MELTTEQFSVLSQMGIPVWELRVNNNEVVETVTTPADTYAEIDLSASYWLVLPQSDLTHEEQRLLTAMLKAIDLQMTEVAILNKEQVSVMPPSLVTNKRVLFLGLEIINEFGGDKAEMIATYTLKQLLADSSLKAHVWQALKRFRR